MPDVDHVVHPVAAGMADPLAAGYELPFGVLAEGIAHAAVAAREADARAHRPRHVAGIPGRQLTARPAGHQQVEIKERLRILQAVQRVPNLDRKALGLQQAGEAAGYELRLVAVPAALENPCFFHVKTDSFLNRMIPVYIRQGRPCPCSWVSKMRSMTLITRSACSGRTYRGLGSLDGAQQIGIKGKEAVAVQLREGDFPGRFPGAGRHGAGGACRSVDDVVPPPFRRLPRAAPSGLRSPSCR